MKLSDLNGAIESLKAERDEVHAKLHKVLADKAMSVLDREKNEAALRAKVLEINEKLYPMEMERAEIDRITKGKPRKRAESWMTEEITLG